MHCQHCGKALPEGTHRFCPWCGQEQAAPAPAPAPGPAGQPLLSPEVQQQAAAAAAEAKKVAANVAQEVQRALNDPRFREAIPGRSLSLVGLAVMGMAILISALPWFSGIGLLWSVIMLAGGALVAVIELRNGGIQHGALDSIPANLLHPLLPPVFAFLVTVHAYLQFSLGVIPLLWAGAAGLLVYDQVQKAKLAPDSFGRYFDPRLAWYGYRKYIVVGVTICLLSLFMTWSASAGHYTGGFESRYSSYYDGYVSEYNFAKYYWPGWDISGRSMSFAFFDVAALLALVAWSAYRGNGTAPSWFNHLGAGLAGVAALFWVLHIGTYLGVLLFLLGLGLIGLALAMIYQGKQTGEYDLDHLMGKVRK